MRKEFYSLCRNIDKGINEKVKRFGYIIETKTNIFGIYKNEYDKFDIIDLKSGLSINYLHFDKLKDFKNKIELFDIKLNDFKDKNKETYKKLCTIFKESELSIDEN